MSNSQQEIARLAQNLYNITEERKLLAEREKDAKRELEEFVESNSGTAIIEGLTGKKLIAEFGDKASVNSSIHPKNLYELSQKLGMEEEFWQSVKVVLTEARAKFPPLALEKITDYTEVLNWRIQYK